MIATAPRATTLTWTELNQRYLSVALAELRQRIAATTDQPPAHPSAELAQLAAQMSAPPAIEALRQTFGLSPFERDLVLLCAGVELDGGPVVSPEKTGAEAAPTFSQAMATLPQPHWSALTPAGPLRRWRLIDLLDGPALTTSPLRIAERVLHYLTGIHYLDEHLAAIIDLADARTPRSPSHQRLVDTVIRAWTADGPRALLPLIQLTAADAASAIAVASAASARLGLQLATIRAEDVPAAPREREELIRLWEREAALGSLALLVDGRQLEAAPPGEERPAAHLLGRVASPALVLTGRPLAVAERQSLHLTVAAPSRAERRAIWAGALGERASGLNGWIGRVADQFALGASDIESVTTEWLLSLAADDASDHVAEDAAVVWDLCRRQTRPRLDGLAQRIEPAAGWDDLVLPAPQKQMLRDVAIHVRQRGRVYGDWGLAAKGERGLGISALFAGPSGTGKTMAAEVLAAELRLDLYRVDLSQVVSKYIGETEKNLGKLFAAAEGGGVILLFDEADALFGKRSEVRDSHDRYANIEVSYLLQRMEAYDGLAILTTNLKGALDAAFLRRIRFGVQFPFPDAEARAAIWRGVFPPQTPVEGLDVAKLAQLSVAGGNIRNIALNAAFIAAEEEGAVGMRHLLQAARTEAAKLERSLSDAEIRGWV